MKFYVKLLAIVFFIQFLAACDSNSYDIDLSNKKSTITFNNIDSLLYSAQKTEYILVKNQILKKDAEIGKYMFGYCYGIPLTPDSSFENGMNAYFHNAFVQKMERSILKSFPIEKRNQKELSDAFIRLKVHFPNIKQPSQIHYINSRFSASVFCTEESIAIGLERYLGPKNPCIKELPSDQFFSWIKEGMKPSYMKRDVVLAWLMTHLIEETDENFSSEMIRWGKLIYITHACLPNDPIHEILRYDKKDYEWAQNSEYALWRYLIDEQLLFNTNEDPKQSLLKEGPFSIGLPDNSPDRMGQFLGFQIVSQYMESEDKSLEELVDIPYNKILKTYKPQKK